MGHIDHTSLIRGLLEAINDHDLDRIAAFYSDDYQGLDLSLAAMHHGPQEVRASFWKTVRAFPDLRITEHAVVAQGERLAFVWSWTGTHRGTFANIPPTGKRIVTCGVSLLWIHEGRIRRGLRIWDMAGMLRSMHLLPDLPDTGAEAGQDALLAGFLTTLENLSGTIPPS